MGKAERVKGHQFERDTAQLWRGWGYDAHTTRLMSRDLDNQGVDIFTDAPFNVQCKHVERLSPGYHEILKSMPNNGNHNLIFHKRANKGIIIGMNLSTFDHIQTVYRLAVSIAKEELLPEQLDVAIQALVESK